MKKMKPLFIPGSIHFIAAVSTVLILASCNQGKMPAKKPVQPHYPGPRPFSCGIGAKIDVWGY
jgi:hypothetical protein